MQDVYLYALGANLFFALGSIAFTHYARKISSIWMNFIKALIATIGFALVLTIMQTWNPLETNQILLFYISGLIGLGVGDIFLFKGFTVLGPGRSLMIFGFQPIILGILSFIFLDQQVTSGQLWAIVFLILCLFTFSLERYRKNGTWEVYGLCFVLAGVFLDAIGVLITRKAFEMDATANAMEGNFYRCLGAISILLIINFFKPFHIFKNLKAIDMKSKLTLGLGSIAGTFISLSLYLKAIQTGNLAVVSAISITGTLFSSTFECFYERKWPSIYLYIALSFFLIGVYLLMS